MAKKKFVSGLVVFLIILALAVTFAALNFRPSAAIDIAKAGNGAHFEFSSSKKPSSGEKEAKSYKKEYIARVCVEGTIAQANQTYDQDWLLSTIEKLRDDDNNRAIALYIDSPGGAVYQTDEVYLALLDYRDTGKKIYVYMGPFAASGGYYMACAGERLYANRNTLTGSIGVIAGQTFDLTGLFDTLGIKSETVHAGRNKNMGNYNEPFTDEQRAILQSVADECYDQFTGIVAQQRGIPDKKVRELADGRIYTAQQALSNGLIDRIGSWESMISDLSEALESPDIKVITFKLERKQSLMNMMLSQTHDFATAQTAARLGLPANVISDIENAGLAPMYLYRP